MDEAIEKAAQVWFQDSCKDIEMDVRLAKEFANTLRPCINERNKYKNAAYKNKAAAQAFHDEREHFKNKSKQLEVEIEDWRARNWQFKKEIEELKAENAELKAKIVDVMGDIKEAMELLKKLNWHKREDGDT